MMEINKNETPIIITVGDTKIKATLNNSTTAKDLISKLPYKVNLNRYEHDYCGTVDEPLKFDEIDKHNGWVNGEIAYVSNYFSILFSGQEISDSYSDMITIGHIKDDLELVKGLGSQIEVTVSLV